MKENNKAVTREGAHLELQPPNIEPLRATKSKVPYVEALAKERDKLRASLNKVSAQRDELLAAAKDALSYTFDSMESAYNWFRQYENDPKAAKNLLKAIAAIAKAEQK